MHATLRVTTSAFLSNQAESDAAIFRELLNPTPEPPTNDTEAAVKVEPMCTNFTTARVEAAQGGPFGMGWAYMACTEVMI